MRVHQAFRYELDPNNAVRSWFASHCGASRFAFNWGLAHVKEQLDRRAEVRLAGYKELLSDEEVETLALGVEVPWSSFYDLCRRWNREKQQVAPWWAENSKFAYESGLKSLADALSNYGKSKRGDRAGPTMAFPTFKKHSSRRSCRFWACSGLSIPDERHVRLA